LIQLTTTLNTAIADPA